MYMYMQSMSTSMSPYYHADKCILAFKTIDINQCLASLTREYYGDHRELQITSTADVVSAQELPHHAEFPLRPADV